MSINLPLEGLVHLREIGDLLFDHSINIAFVEPAIKDEVHPGRVSHKANDMR